MTDPGKRYFRFSRRTTGILTVAAGAVAGSGICYGLFYSGAIRLPDLEKYHIKNFKDTNTELFPQQWVSPQLANKHENAVVKCRELVMRFKEETAAPGIVVGVSVDGQVVWKEGFGYADLENGSRCHSSTAMRIASISKPITMTLLAKFWEDGKVDLDKPIHEYVNSYPVKEIDGEMVTITTRQLASHTAGIRHYTKKGEEKGKDNNLQEFYIKEKFDNVDKALDLFKNDELLFKPGTSFEYTTHGYTLLSAVMESIGKQSFKEMIQDVFKVLRMQNTYLDDVNAIIYNRACYYSKNKKGRLINAELADNSYKWAGGGIVSTVGDLLTFGNAMLYCYQQTESDKAGYLKRETIEKMWTPVKHSKMSWDKGAGYGLGWVVVPSQNEIGGIPQQDFYIGHAGGAVGASSILLIVPRERDKNYEHKIPSGITIAILTNMQDVSCHKLAKKIAEQFS